MSDAQKVSQILHSDLYITSRGDYGYGVFLFDTAGWSKADFDELDAASNESRVLVALQIRTAVQIRNVKSGLDNTPSPLHHQPKGVSDE